uniref:PaaD-like zinc ribbon domain-containing protein n=1 Tax=Macromonas nakdongensis TaxID=1843082 RepID=UPI003F72E211
AGLAGLGVPARVVTQLAPAWTTDWMSAAAKDKLRAYGIAPPHAACAGERAGEGVLRFVRGAAEPGPAVACPHCGSVHTVESSRFGSTACKALYKCLDCQEPFDYFKPY